MVTVRQKFGKELVGHLHAALDASITKEKVEQELQKQQVEVEQDAKSKLDTAISSFLTKHMAAFKIDEDVSAAIRDAYLTDVAGILVIEVKKFHEKRWWWTDDTVTVSDIEQGLEQVFREKGASLVTTFEAWISDRNHSEFHGQLLQHRESLKAVSDLKQKVEGLQSVISTISDSQTKSKFETRRTQLLTQLNLAVNLQKDPERDAKVKEAQTQFEQLQKEVNEKIAQGEKDKATKLRGEIGTLVSNLEQQENLPVDMTKYKNPRELEGKSVSELESIKSQLESVPEKEDLLGGLLGTLNEWKDSARSLHPELGEILNKVFEGLVKLAHILWTTAPQLAAGIISLSAMRKIGYKPETDAEGKITGFKLEEETAAPETPDKLESKRNAGKEYARKIGINDSQVLDSIAQDNNFLQNLLVSADSPSEKYKNIFSQMHDYLKTLPENNIKNSDFFSFFGDINRQTEFDKWLKDNQHATL